MSAASARKASARKILLRDAFEKLRPGLIKEAVDGPYREMHAQPAHPADNIAGWELKTGHWNMKNPWSCVETPHGKRLQSTVNATIYDNIILNTTQRDFCNVEVSSEVTLLDPRSVGASGWGGPAGVLVRFLDSQRYYAAIVDRDGMAKIARRLRGDWDVLAATPFDAPLNSPISIRIQALGARLSAQIGRVKLAAVDYEFPSGAAGFIGARPAQFGPLTVACSAKEFKRTRAAARASRAALHSKRRRAPDCVLWKKLDTRGFGSGRRIRLGDIDGDGHLEIVFSRARYDQPGNLIDVSSLAALNLDGKLLWTCGAAPPVPPIERSADTPFQVNDIDGDGKAEIVAVMDRRIVVLDGATGRERFSLPVPKIEKLPAVYKNNLGHWGSGFGDETDQWPVATLAFADLTKRGARRDLLLLDHYHHTVALDLQTRRELWREVNPHGHFPLAIDLDGDGRDSVMLGYRHVNYDGQLLGRVCMQDHQDAIFCGPLDDDGKGPYEILMCGGEDGLLRLTPDYDIHQRVMGHVQRLAIGKFRTDRRGLTLSTVLFHGNRGIVSLFDANLMRIWTKDFPVVGATLQPVLFDGSGAEYMFLSAIRPAQGYAGGLIDGDGDLAVPLPDDGGPGLCAFAYDLDGDGLDELLTWDHDRMWIYKSSWDGDRAKLLRRARPHLYNMSNFQANYSVPAGLNL